MAVLSDLSLSCGFFTTFLETRNATPVYKDPKLKCSNYGSISLWSNTDKVFESIIYNFYNLFTKFFLENKLIYNLQFGFRQKHSISHALTHLADKIHQQFDSGKYGCKIFVDFQKAFDTADHVIFTQMLNYYGVRGNANIWFSSYLKNRTQFVTIDGFKSDLKETNCDIPQEPIL